MNFTVRLGFQPLAIAIRRISVSVAMPDASSSAPGATWVVLPPALPLIESRCAPSTTISFGSSLPWMVRITDGWVEQVLHADRTLVTSVRLPARALPRRADPLRRGLAGGAGVVAVLVGRQGADGALDVAC